MNKKTFIEVFVADKEELEALKKEKGYASIAVALRETLKKGKKAKNENS